MTMRLYPSRFFIPSQIVAETITEDKWHHNHSQPVRNQTSKKAQSLLVAALAGCVLTPIAYPGNGLAKPVQVTTSVRHDRTIIFDDLFAPVSFQAPGVPGDETALPITVATSVRHDKTVIFDDLFYTPYVTEVITSDKWFAPPSQPTRRKVGATVGTYVIGAIQPQAGDAVGWHRALSEPIRRVATRQQQELASVPFIEDAAIQAKWFQPFGTPRAAKRAAEYPASFYSPYFVPSLSGTGTEFNWWPNLSERLRSPRPVTQQQSVAFAGKPDDLAWFYPGLDQPTRIKVRQNQGSFVYPYQTVGMGTPGDASSLPFTVSTSVRYDRTVIYDDLVYTPIPIAPAQPGNAVRLQTWANLSEPVRAKPRLQGAFTWYPFTYGDGSALAFTVTTVGQHYAKTIVYEDRFQTHFAAAATPGDASALPIVVTTSVQFNKTIIFDDLAQSLYPVAVPTPGSGNEFNWWSNLSERLRQHRPVAQQQAIIQGPLNPITLTLEYAWHRPLSEPTRRKREAQTAGGVFNPFPQITISWHQPLQLPTRRKSDPGIHGSIQWVYVSPTGVGVGTDQPWPPFAEPVRFKLGLSHQLQQALAFSVLPITIVAAEPPPCLIDTLGAFDNSDVPFGDSAAAPLGDSSDEPFGDASDNPGSFDNEDEAPC